MREMNRDRTHFTDSHMSEPVPGTVSDMRFKTLPSVVAAIVEGRRTQAGVDSRYAARKRASKFRSASSAEIVRFE